MGNLTPLRINPRDKDIDGATPEGKARVRDTGRIAIGARILVPVNETITADDAQAALEALESAAKRGSLYDMPVSLLSIRQEKRYLPNGRDNAKDLVESIVGVAVGSEKGTKAVRVCNFETGCDSTPISPAEWGSTLTELIPITDRMNPRRSIAVGTGMSSTMAFIAVMNRPDLVSGTQTPEQIMAAALAANPNAVKENRDVVRACIRQDNDPVLDLPTCAKAGARAAINFMAQNRFRFEEVNPMELTPIPDAPKSEQQKFARENPRYMQQ